MQFGEQGPGTSVVEPTSHLNVSPLIRDVMSRAIRLNGNKIDGCETRVVLAPGQTRAVYDLDKTDSAKLVMCQYDLCALRADGKADLPPGGFFRCAKCKLCTYCGPECQKLHWHIHKKLCKQLRQEQPPAAPWPLAKFTTRSSAGRLSDLATTVVHDEDVNLTLAIMHSAWSNRFGEGVTVLIEVEDLLAFDSGSSSSSGSGGAGRESRLIYMSPFDLASMTAYRPDLREDEFEPGSKSLPRPPPVRVPHQTPHPACRGIQSKRPAPRELWERLMQKEFIDIRLLQAISQTFPEVREGWRTNDVACRRVIPIVVFDHSCGYSKIMTATNPYSPKAINKACKYGGKVSYSRSSGGVSRPSVVCSRKPAAAAASPLATIAAEVYSQLSHADILCVDKRDAGQLDLETADSDAATRFYALDFHTLAAPPS